MSRTKSVKKSLVKTKPHLRDEILESEKIFIQFINGNIALA